MTNGSNIHLHSNDQVSNGIYSSTSSVARSPAQSKRAPAPDRKPLGSYQTKLYLEALREQYELALAEKKKEEHNEKNAAKKVEEKKETSARADNHSVKKSRTQEDEDAGRTLLVFLKELQTNHNKAVSDDTETAFPRRSNEQSTMVTDPFSGSASASEMSSSNHEYKKKRNRSNEYLLNHNFNLSVQNRNKDYEASRYKGGTAGRPKRTTTTKHK